jgi:Tfp pilus assembly pilus retraction ATPase PilT
LPSKILSFDTLGVGSNDVLSVCKGTGLTLFCGPTGSGKSTTMNTVIDSLLNSGELGVTITIEDPVEYLHHKDTIFQREVGTKVKDLKMYYHLVLIAGLCNQSTLFLLDIYCLSS